MTPTDPLGRRSVRFASVRVRSSSIRIWLPAGGGAFLASVVPVLSAISMMSITSGGAAVGIEQPRQVRTGRLAGHEHATARPHALHLATLDEPVGVPIAGTQPTREVVDGDRAFLGLG